MESQPPCPVLAHSILALWFGEWTTFVLGIIAEYSLRRLGLGEKAGFWQQGGYSTVLSTPQLQIAAAQEFTPESVAFITGAGSGIGLAVAQRLVADGIKNIALIDLTEDRLAEAISSLRNIDSSANVLKIGCDCSQEAAVETAVEEAVKKFGRLDVCFNAAGMGGERGKIVDQSTSNLDSVLGLNLKGVWYCERAEIRQMMRQDMRDVTTGLNLKTRGSIVNVGSLTSHLAINNLAPYVMAKHGVLGLTRADAVDYGQEGIRINCICPGWIKTKMTEFVYDSPMGARLAARAPMNRWGLPEEVAYTVSFLSSDKASFITGASIDVDGGYGAC